MGGREGVHKDVKILSRGDQMTRVENHWNKYYLEENTVYLPKEVVPW